MAISNSKLLNYQRVFITEISQPCLTWESMANHPHGIPSAVGHVGHQATVMRSWTNLAKDFKESVLVSTCDNSDQPGVFATKKSKKNVQ